MAKMKNPMSLFKGKDNYAEEIKEARAIKSGRISPEDYAKGEKKEESMKGAKGYATGGIVRGAGAAQRGKRFTRAG